MPSSIFPMRFRKRWRKLVKDAALWMSANFWRDVDLGGGWDTVDTVEEIFGFDEALLSGTLKLKKCLRCLKQRTKIKKFNAIFGRVPYRNALYFSLFEYSIRWLAVSSSCTHLLNVNKLFSRSPKKILTHKLVNYL